MMHFEKLSQGQLIHLATTLRVEFKGKIDKYLIDELNAIVHHHEKTNPYHGEWNPYRRNCVIHQIFNKIIPMEERENFIEKHPMEELNERLKENIKEKQFYIKEQQKELVSMKIKEASIDTKIKNYENFENMDDKGKAELLASAKEEILLRLSLIRHHDATIFQPLKWKGWIDPRFLELPEKDSGGWVSVNDGPVDYYSDSDGNGGFNPYEKPDLIYNPSDYILPFKGVRNKDILDVKLPSVDTVNGIVKVRNELMTRCRQLTEENTNLKEDNKKLLKIIRENEIDII